MGWLDWFAGGKAAPAQVQSKACTQDFPQLFSSFIDSFVDFGYTGSSTTQPSQDYKKKESRPEIPTVVPAPKRLVAIGDLHGDFAKSVRAFKLAGLINNQGRWIGGDTVCVQVGDVLDRGDQELQILYFLERLQQEAEQAGGKLYILNGNHETMNVMGNHRYATPGATIEMVRWLHWQALGARLKQLYSGSTNVPDPLPALPDNVPYHMLGGPINPIRSASLQPGSTIARRFFADRPTVLQVGSTVFVHGGVLPSHVEYGLERINRETQEWLHGDNPAAKVPLFLRGATAIVWARDFSAEDPARCDCAKLEEVLKSMPGAGRMVMGHTIQDQGINAACNDKAYRVDVGMSRGCGNRGVEALEILEDKRVRRLREGLPAEELSGAQPQRVLERWRAMVKEAMAKSPAAA